MGFGYEKLEKSGKSESEVGSQRSESILDYDVFFFLTSDFLTIKIN